MEINVHEFDPVIYPRKLWVMWADENQQLDQFRYADSKSVLTPPINCYACTYIEVENTKRDQLAGELVCLMKDKEITTGTIAHEAVHVANGMFSGLDVGYTTSSDEALAYLTGWAADCIQEVAKDKPKEE